MNKLIQSETFSCIKDFVKRIKAHNRFIVLILLLIASGIRTELFSATITSAGSGNWNSTTNNAPWPGGVVPATTDLVVIAIGNNVTVTVAATCAGVTVNSLGILTINQSITLTVNGDINGAGQLAGQALTPYGFISTTGNFNFTGSYNALGRISLTFNGNGDQTINSSAAV